MSSILLLLALSSPAAAASTPAMDGLKALASGSCPAETCFDGAPVLRREGSYGLVRVDVLSERKETGTVLTGYYGDDGFVRTGEMVQTYRRRNVRQTWALMDRREHAQALAFADFLLGLLPGVGLGFLLGAPLAGALVVAAAAAGFGYWQGKHSPGTLTVTKEEVTP